MTNFIPRGDLLAQGGEARPRQVTSRKDIHRETPDVAVKKKGGRPRKAASEKKQNVTFAAAPSTLEQLETYLTANPHLNGSVVCHTALIEYLKREMQ